MFKQSGKLGGELAAMMFFLFAIAATIAGLYGYVMNVIKALDDHGVRLLVRIVGMIVPVVGAIIGWF